MMITLGCGHEAEVDKDLPEEQIHYMKHLGLCSLCSGNIKNALEARIKELAAGIKDVKCPCCGETTSTGSEINDPEDDSRGIVTCEVNGCEFYIIEYTDGTTLLEPREHV